MEEKSIFVQLPDGNKWEHYNDDPDKLLLLFLNPGFKDQFKVWEMSSIFYRDTHWDRNFKDDGQEYYIYEEADIDDDDDFYGGEFLIGDPWEED